MEIQEIKNKVTTDRRWLERAIVAIFNFQTYSEQRNSETNEDNGVGFNGPDAYMMSYYANWIKSGKHLSGAHLEKAFKKIGKYAGQLTKIAGGKVT